MDPGAEDRNLQVITVPVSCLASSRTEPEVRWDWGGCQEVPNTEPEEVRQEVCWYGSFGSDQRPGTGILVDIYSLPRQG